MKPFGLVLVGGQGARMGGTAKALLPVGGRTLLARVLASLVPQCDGLALGIRGDPAPWSGFADLLLQDLHLESHGPLAGVLAGLRYLAERGRHDQALLSVPCDTPFLPPDLAERLDEARARTGSPVAIAVSDDRHHPTVALWPVQAVGMIEEAMEAGQRSVGAVQTVLGRTVATWETNTVDPFFNVNTPDDLRRADQWARASR